MSDLNHLVRLLKACMTKEDYVTLTVERMGQDPSVVNYTGQITHIGDGAVYLTGAPGPIQIQSIMTLDKHVPGEDLHPGVKAAINQQRIAKGLPPI